MDECSSRHDVAVTEVGRREPLLPSPKPPSSMSWRLDVKEFHLPRLSGDHPNHRSLGFERLLRRPRKQRKVAEYYEKQRRLLEGFHEMDTMNETGFCPGSLTEDEMKQLAKRERVAVHVSNIANLVLFAAKVYASVMSQSLAVIASTLDSLLDLLSGLILWFTSHAMKNPNQYHYPIGKKRMQPVGIIVFASVMATLGLQILLESGRRLIGGVFEFNFILVVAFRFIFIISGLKSNMGVIAHAFMQQHIFMKNIICFVLMSKSDMSTKELYWMIGIMATVTLVKFVLMVYCRRFKNEIVRAFAQDHFFDVVTNSVGLAAAVLAVKFVWWIDPTGAIVIALYTINTWARTVIENVRSLIGRTAPPEFLTKLTYLIWNHHEQIQHIDTVRAYTFGGHYFVEVDIVLPEDMLLNEAHNIGETLQIKLEQLPEVERAFVHIDFEFTHRPEHKTMV